MNLAPRPWPAAVARFFEARARLDARLASEAPLGFTRQRLFQGPIADRLTHTGNAPPNVRLAGARRELPEGRHRGEPGGARAVGTRVRVRLSSHRVELRRLRRAGTRLRLTLLAGGAAPGLANKSTNSDSPGAGRNCTTPFQAPFSAAIARSSFFRTASSPTPSPTCRVNGSVPRAFASACTRSGLGTIHLRVPCTT